MSFGLTQGDVGGHFQVVTRLPPDLVFQLSVCIDAWLEGGGASVGSWGVGCGRGLGVGGLGLMR